MNNLKSKCLGTMYICLNRLIFLDLHAEGKCSTMTVTIPVGLIIAVRQPVRVFFQAYFACPVFIVLHVGEGRIAIWIHLF